MTLNRFNRNRSRALTPRELPLAVYAAALSLGTACSSETGGPGTNPNELAGTGGAGLGGGFAAGGTLAGNGAGGAGVMPGAAPVPCDIAATLTNHCALCHSSPSRYGAPMSLMGATDFHANAKLAPGSTVAQRAVELLSIQDTSQRMPPPGTVDSLSPAALQRLTEWLNQGAPTDPSGCFVSDPEATSGGAGGAASNPGGMGGATPGGGGTPGAAGAGVGGLGAAGAETGAGGAGEPQPPASGLFIEPYPGWDQGVECYPFLAHDGSKQGKYAVGVANDAYFGFSFMPPWSGKKYVRAFKRVTDNAQVLHHWLFFQQSGPVSDGAVSPQIGAHPDGQLLHGWAPGGSDVYLSPDIGVEMSGDTGYLLELHYNSSDASARDASGLEVCVTDDPPENISLLSWLGTDAISGTTATGTCTPRGNERIRIIAGTPHMHLKGTHMKVVINRANGQQEIAHDEPFAFENQRIYPEDIWLEPGDTITTTCSFNSPASFGPGTNQEMCYWFAMHYPPLALADGALVGTLIHGPNSCLGL